MIPAWAIETPILPLSIALLITYGVVVLVKKLWNCLTKDNKNANK